MKVIVCGAGQVGNDIARYLAVAGNDVTAIDHRAGLTHKIGESLDIQATTGATEVTPFARDRVRLIAARCGPDCLIVDTPLRQLTFLLPDLHLTCVGSIPRDRLFVPSGHDRLIAGHEVYSVVETGLSASRYATRACRAASSSARSCATAR
jgi:Trk K+ transport system NAD-binding subunit